MKWQVVRSGFVPIVGAAEEGNFVVSAALALEPFDYAQGRAEALRAA
jgi:hypothetical protein